MSEWFMVRDLKSLEVSKPPWVRIPLPPLINTRNDLNGDIIMSFLDFKNDKTEHEVMFNENVILTAGQPFVFWDKGLWHLAKIQFDAVGTDMFMRLPSLQITGNTMSQEELSKKSLPPMAVQLDQPFSIRNVMVVLVKDEAGIVTLRSI